MEAYGDQLATNAGSSPLSAIIGSGEAMQKVFALTRRVAESNASVLLLGETGTGKELVATAIHRLSRRASGPFVKVNCGALSESLLESELFGHVRGAFTGAVGNRAGRFEAAHTGSLFLDEINSTSLLLQVKLLRVLQEREFERVGDTQTITVDTRVIAASNRNLETEVAEERFREDLFWRLNVVPIEIPPLRHRQEDIPELVAHFLQHYSEINERYVVHIQPSAIEALQSYHWPGNVRELQNYVERAVVLAETDELTIDLLPSYVTGSSSPSQLTGGVGNSKSADTATLATELVEQAIREANDDAMDLHNQVVDRIEKELIQQILRECSNVQTKASKRLGINRNTLHKKIKDYEIDSPET